MLKGKLVRLREMRREDADPIRKLINDEDVLYFIRNEVPFPFTEKDEEQFIEGISATKDQYNFGIESLRTGQLIGACGFNQVSWKNRWAECGIFIGEKELWGHGYGSDAIRLLLRFAFEEMNLHRVMVGVFSFNERALMSYEKCGFVREAVLREHIFKRGRYHDLIMMGMLKQEYLERYFTAEQAAEDAHDR
ncbi:MAG: GNAT family protein [Bacillota bacterium]|nr:GNAT family protein [Bacillota bacterium]